MSGSGLARWLRRPFDATVGALEPIVLDERPLRRSLALAVCVAIAWHLYVPVHELLHAAGCALTGGTVTTLEIQTQYGGGLLERVFPFVRAGGEYAGRLSDFDTHGSDLVYLATDALPFVLSALVGVPLLRRAAGRPRPALAGAGFVLGLAPFYNLPGDYFEMGSIAVTRLLDPRFQALRSDDLFRLLAQIFEDPAALGLSASDTLPALAAAAAALCVGIVLAYLTWELGERIARRLAG